MKQLVRNLKVDKVKQTLFSGGNICISKCGKYLLCIYGSSVNVIDIETGIIKHELSSEEEEITSILLSPDDRHLITAHRNLILKQWDNWKDFQFSQITLDNEDMSNNDKKQHKVSRKCTRTWKAIHSAPIVFMSFDPTSTLLATASSDFTTKVWDINAQYCTHNLKGAQGIIRVCKFHPLIEQIQQCITGSEDSKLRIYNLNTSKMEACLEGHFSSITCFDFIKNENNNSYDRLLSSSRDKVLIMWDLIEYAKLKTIPIYESLESILLVSNLFETDNDRFLITMGNEGILKIWDTRTGQNLYKQNENDSLKVLNKRKTKGLAELELIITQCVYNKETNSLVLVTTDQFIIFFHINKELIKENLKNLKFNDLDSIFSPFKQYIGDHGEILDTQFCNTNENLLAMASNSEFLKIYNLNTWDCKLLKGHEDLIICLSVYHDKKNPNITFLASSSKDSTIRIWKIVQDDSNSNNYTTECIHVCRGHTQDVGSISFSRMNLSFLISGSVDTTLKLWKLDTTDDQIKVNVLFTVKAHEKDINSVNVSPNDKLFCSGSSDKTIKLWDTNDGSCVAVLRGHKRGIWCVQFSPVDQILASSSADATIKLWSLNDFTCIKTFEGHNTSVLKLFFLNHGTQLISAASDGLVKLWNISNNECVNTFDEHDDKIWAFCMSKDEKKFVTGAADGKLVVWKDVSNEAIEIEMENRETILLQEQELSNYLKEKKWKKALSLAILLDKPYRCYQIIKEILEQTDSNNNNEKNNSDLEKTLLKLRHDQIKTILRYIIEWNTNTKYYHVAQNVFEIILKNYSPEELIDDQSNFEFVSKLIEQFLPYTERHYLRINKLAQQTMFIDFVWKNMKLEDKF